MPDEAADDREAVLLGGDLDRVRDVGEPVAGPALLDPSRKGGPAAFEQPLHVGGDLADRERVSRVGDEAVECDAHVHREDVALLERAQARNPVHDHVVRRGADRGRVAAVALERRHATPRADELVRERVELLGGHARARALAEQGEHVRDDLARARHPLDLLGALADDHRRTAACSSARWISPKTSSSGRSARTPTRFPRVR